MDRRRMRPEELGRNMICLGKAGENGAIALVFDCAEWLREYPEGTIRLYVQTAGEEAYYPPLGTEGTDRTWVIDSEKATKAPGNGVIELLLIDAESGTTIKSATGYTTVKRSPSAGLKETDGEPGYVRYDTAQTLTDDQKAQARANIGAGTSSGNGEGTGEPGADGEGGGYYTPAVDASGNLTWSASKADMPSVPSANIKGPAGRDGNDGKDGPQGLPGRDGRGIVNIKRTGGDGSAGTVDTYTITYTDGTTSTYTVTNGKNGQNASGDGTLSVEIDETLSISGAAADAKMTGDKLNELNEAIEVKGDPTDEQVAAAVNAYLTENPVSGLSKTASSLLITILRSGVYTDDQSANITALEAALGGSTEPDEPDDPVVTTYTISNELINCTSSNSAASVKENAAYSATLTANDGHTLDGGTVNVTMGGTDITSTGYADGVITIAAVTGNVEIFASAVAVQAEAELPEDGLLAYFDLRNAPTDQKVGTASGIPTATKGSGALFSWASQAITSADDYGAVLPRSLQFSADGTTTQTNLGTEFSVITLVRGAVQGGSNGELGVINTNISPRWKFKGRYNTDSGLASTDEIGSGNKDDADDYNFGAYRVSGTKMISVFDTSRCDFNGEDYDGFVSWYALPNIGTIFNQGTTVACAIYDRMLSDSEIEEAREFMKTLEVTA